MVGPYLLTFWDLERPCKSQSLEKTKDFSVHELLLEMNWFNGLGEILLLSWPQTLVPEPFLWPTPPLPEASRKSCSVVLASINHSYAPRLLPAEKHHPLPFSPSPPSCSTERTSSPFYHNLNRSLFHFKSLIVHLDLYGLVCHTVVASKSRWFNQSPCPFTCCCFCMWSRLKDFIAFKPH